MADCNRLNPKVAAIDKIYERPGAIGDAFREYYERHGYDFMPGQPAYPSPDDTVMFVGAQISLWKPLIDDIARGNVPALITPQDCIRVQNRDIFYTDEDMRFCSYFRIQGAIARAGEFTNMISSAVDFVNSIGVDRERIVIKVAEDQAHMVQTDVDMLVQSEDDAYYSWTYGEDHLTGRGVTLALRNEKTGGLHDIGNVITISRDGEPLVAEWGFGEETLLTAIHSEGPPVLYSDLPDDLINKLNNHNSYKYADALMTAVAIFGLGVQPGARGEGAVLDDYIRAAAFHGILEGYLYQEILTDCRGVATHTAVEGIEAAVIRRLEYYIGKVNYAINLAKKGTLAGADQHKLAGTLHLNDKILNSINGRYRQ